ncbi:uncharacterized protein [Periplaneta americana]|uniref:uncharacterized protein isoform X2 n=1 Tax=Periplaneta americana TaxID=6978 RepID=UPI0037E88B4B
MDVIKMEPELDPLATQADVEDKKPLLEREDNSLNLHVTGIKEECADHSYDLPSEMKLEESPMSFHSPMVKCETKPFRDAIKLFTKEQAFPMNSIILVSSFPFYFN